MSKIKSVFRVLLIEDTASTYEKLKQLVPAHLAGDLLSFQRYEREKMSSEPPVQSEIENLLIGQEKPDLVFLDWDLSKYKEPVSRRGVIGACDELGIPLCLYHYEPREKDKIESMKRWDQNLIMVQDCASEEELATRITAYSNGFNRIYQETKNPRIKLGNLVNRILDTPEDSEINIDQYLWSKFNPLQVANVDPDRVRTRLTSSLGYWISNVLLQFPGPVLSVGAAASYLDIFEEDFKKEEVQALFAKARYTGAFNETGPYWWRGMLDEIIANSLSESDTEMVSGGEFAKRSGIDLRRSRCFWDHDGAGYFCIVRRKPVCSNPEHSVNPSGWVPLGADLSRIERKKYDELKAWMSI